MNKITARILILVLLALLPAIAGAQADSTFAKGSHHLCFNANFDMNSTGLTNEFIGAFYYGRDLSYELRNKVSRRLGDKNIAGYNLAGSIFYIFAPNSFNKKVGYYLGIEEHSMAELGFRKNFYDLMFFGNEQYKGRAVKFDEMKLTMMDWQQFKAGIFKAYHRKKSVHQIGFGIALNKGQKHLSADIQRASLFTEKDARYIALDVDMDVRRTDTANSKFFAFNGYGLALDLAYNFTDKHENEFQVRISNIGYIRWDKSPDNYHRDTTFRFEGFDVDMLSLQSPVFDSTTIDSITGKIYGSNRQKAYSVMLPLDINLMYKYYSPSGHFTLTTEFTYRFFSLYKPRIVLKPGYTWFLKPCHSKTAVKKASAAGSSVSIYTVFTYGGYGLFNAGLDLELNIRQKLMLGLGTGTINSLLSPGNSAGLAGNITLYKMF